MNEKVLEIKNLSVNFKNEHSEDIHAVRDVEFDMHKGKAFGLVGESGCGKSVTVKTILQLHDRKATRFSGEINYDGKNLLECNDKELNKIRGKSISMIFQDAMTSLNPLITVGDQIAEVLNKHLKMRKNEAKKRAIEIMTSVGISSPEMRYNQYPHEFSGGMQQRIMIAIALACEPEILLADEPTTALDVTIQAQILNLMRTIKTERQTSILMITHDLGVVANICDEIGVMYAGTIVEYADAKTIFKNPLHPYTKGLLSAMPRMGSKLSRLEIIKGQPPKLVSKLESQCPFSNRCKHATEKCFAESPKKVTLSDGHFVKCHHFDNL